MCQPSSLCVGSDGCLLGAVWNNRVTTCMQPARVCGAPPHTGSDLLNEGSQNFKQTSENPGQKFSELWTQLLRTPGQSSQKFPKMRILRVKLQFTPSGQTSENPRPKFSEVGTQLLRMPGGSLPELGFEAPGPQHRILECPV